jgi:RimJ/RimL family protein N-acetyltransferase
MTSSQAFGKAANNPAPKEIPNLSGWTMEIQPLPDLTLRPLRSDEVSDRYVDGINNPIVSRFLISAIQGKITKRDIQDFVGGDWEACDAVLFGIFVAGVHCGNVRLYAVTADVAQIGIVIFDVEAQGRGVGSAALAAAAQYAIDGLGTGRVVAGINHANIASKKAFAAAGFRCVEDNPAAEGSLWHYP